MQDFVEGRAAEGLAACLPSSTACACFWPTPRRRLPTRLLGRLVRAGGERALLIDLLHSACSPACATLAACWPLPCRIDHLLALHDSFMLDSYLRPLGDAEGTHLPVRRFARLCSRLARLCSRLGWAWAAGHCPPAPSADGGPRRLAEHCDAAWYGSWGAVWRLLRGWLPTLRGASLAGSGEGAQLEFLSSLALAFDPSTVCPPPWTPFAPTRTSPCFLLTTTCM